MKTCNRNSRVWPFLGLLIILGLSSHLVCTSARVVQVLNKQAVTGGINPLLGPGPRPTITTTTTPSPPPPEGNTTFLEGTTWCVALPGASQVDLEIALNWACGPGQADCGPIQAGGPCFRPDTLVNHASYAFNSYYQQNGNNEIACYFGGTATLTKRNPSYGKCRYDVTENITSSAMAEMINSGFRVINTTVLIIIFTIYCLF